MINIDLDLEIYIFLIKDYDIKIFSLSIFIRAIISRLSLDVIILSFNIKERDRRLINSTLNTSATSIKLYLFPYYYLNYILYYSQYNSNI